ncbi:ABC transporter permease [Hyphomicrobium sp.]|jgi:hypothetical protein|uniref:ABC transporter permease n=1 Tax=Hyphomicrobium sp. TaxID=82 RepID=UPI002BB70BFF|nr:ABC transporter permease [Hyphomicrobium sp.]HVZ03618.1 ABC transporter permease [Hyphomicrobium sp.]
MGSSASDAAYAVRDRHVEYLANALVITVAVSLSLTFVVQKLLNIPISGSVPLFMFGVVLYLFLATVVGLFLATIARTMPQLGLLYMLVAIPLNMLRPSFIEVPVSMSSGQNSWRWL